MAGIRICDAGSYVFYLFQQEQSRLQLPFWDGNPLGARPCPFQQSEMDSLPDFQREMEIIVIPFLNYRKLHLLVLANTGIQQFGNISGESDRQSVPNFPFRLHPDLCYF